MPPTRGPEEAGLAGLDCDWGTLGLVAMGLVRTKLKVWLTELYNNRWTRFNGVCLGFTSIGPWGVKCMVVWSKVSKFVRASQRDVQ